MIYLAVHNSSYRLYSVAFSNLLLVLCLHLTLNIEQSEDLARTRLEIESCLEETLSVRTLLTIQEVIHLLSCEKISNLIGFDSSPSILLD
jgi:hypothetical protein